MSNDFYTETQDFITIFKFLRSTDVAVDAWAIAIEDHIRALPRQTPFYVLVDVTGDDVAFTALARQQSKRIFATYRDHVGYLAFLFQWRTSPYFARLFFASLGKLAFKLNYFHNASQALQWLQHMHADSKNKTTRQ